MSYDPVLSSVSGGPSTHSITLRVQGENGGLLASSAFTRWWGAQVNGLTGGETLNFSITNLGAGDIILPVWATSTDGVNFTPDARCPVSATPNISQQFTLVVPAGVTALRVWKYFPYTIADRDAFLASLPAVSPSGPVRFNGSIGNSVEGRPIPMIELSSGAGDAGKRRVWIHAGIHSAETTSYFVVEGLVDFLLNSGTPEAANLLSGCIFNIVPMLNVDGNARGNYRASAPHPPVYPNGADMESRYNDGGLGVAGFPECQAVIDRIVSYNSVPPAPPTAAPVEMILNLHTTHGFSRPMHFRHNPVYPPNGVIQAITDLEDLWLGAFAFRSPNFVNPIQTSGSNLIPRGYVESWAHDFYSNNPSYSGPDIMAITYEGVYQQGIGGTTWNTTQDWRDNGHEMALAIGDHFGIAVPASLTRLDAY